MDLNKFLSEDRAVSPVIGVILMVAITVILAAVIGTFVLGLGDQVQTTAPNAQFTGDQPNSDVTAGNAITVVEFTHKGGDSIDSDNLDISHSLADENGTYSVNTPTGDVTAGNSVELEYDSDSGASGETEAVEGDEVNLVWESDDGGDSQILRTFEMVDDIEIE